MPTEFECFDIVCKNQDFGIIPGTPKPTLLKPGAEKILMLMGLRSEFTVVDSTRDFDNANNVMRGMLQQVKEVAK